MKTREEDLKWQLICTVAQCPQYNPSCCLVNFFFMAQAISFLNGLLDAPTMQLANNKDRQEWSSALLQSWHFPVTTEVTIVASSCLRELFLRYNSPAVPMRLEGFNKYIYLANFQKSSFEWRKVFFHCTSSEKRNMHVIDLWPIIDDYSYNNASRLPNVLLCLYEAQW